MSHDVEAVGNGPQMLIAFQDPVEHLVLYRDCGQIGKGSVSGFELDQP